MFCGVSLQLFLVSSFLLLEIRGAPLPTASRVYNVYTYRIKFNAFFTRAPPPEGQTHPDSAREAYEIDSKVIATFTGTPYYENNGYEFPRDTENQEDLVDSNTFPLERREAGFFNEELDDTDEEGRKVERRKRLSFDG